MCILRPIAQARLLVDAAYREPCVRTAPPSSPIQHSMHAQEPPQCANPPRGSTRLPVLLNVPWRYHPISECSQRRGCYIIARPVEHSEKMRYA